MIGGVARQLSNQQVYKSEILSYITDGKYLLRIYRQIERQEVLCFQE